MSQSRRLAAILAADVVGYSRLMGDDEEGTHERVQAHLVELVDPKIREHHGRVVKTTGDGVLAEFASVVDAVRCAGEIQRAMAERDLDLAEERRLRFRIGVNLGDVIADGDDIYGDGVNIAARLEGLAAPGSICVSGTVRDHIGDRLPYAFEDMGEQSVKNIARRVRAYAFRPEGTAGLPTASVSSVSSKFAAPRRATPVDRRPALYEPQRRPGAAVFRGRDHRGSDDRSLEAREYVRDLAQYRVHLPEQADRHEADRPRARRALCAGRQRQAIGQPGPRQRPADRCQDRRASLADRFDRDTNDLFVLQSEITGRLANALGVELIAAEAARPTEHPDALDYILRGRAVLFKPRTRDTYWEAISFFERALALDPQSVEAQSRLAGSLASRVLIGLSDSRAADLARANELIGRALAASPRYGFAHYAKGSVLRAQNRWEEAVPEFEAALASNPNMLSALNGLSWCKLFAGSIDEVTPLVEQAIRLSPRDPLICHFYYLIGTVHLLQSHTDEAIVWLEKARSDMPTLPFHRSRLASAYALRGETERAAAELAEARRLSSDDRFSSIAHVKAFPGAWWGAPKTRALYEATYFAGLRKAGVPEE